MLRKRLSAVLALVVALMFALQAGPLYSFAEESDGGSGQTAAEQQDSNVKEEDVSFYIDGNGEKQELTDEIRQEAYSEDSSSGLKAADTDSFFAREDGEVAIDGEVSDEASKAAGDIVATDAAALAIPSEADASNLIVDFKLPIKGSYGSDISWASSDESIVSIDAEGNVTVTRPAYTGAGSREVTLTATLTRDHASATKELKVKVPEMPPADGEAAAAEENSAEADIEAFELPIADDAGNTLSAGSVKGSFTLPTTGAFGSTFSYVSSNPALIAVESGTGKATVTRPAFSGAGTQAVELTITATYEATQASKTIELDVVELDPATDAEKALYDVNNALISGVDTNNIRQSSFYLEDRGSFGSTLTWASSDESVIEIKPGDYVDGDDSGSDSDTDGEGNEDVNPPQNQGGYTAVVTRPSNGYDALVTLTVTANINGQKASRDIVVSVVADEGLRAFPSAEGYGQYAKGGRGGRVYHVTTLEATGYGSLKYGIEDMSGPRTIVFDVGGVIDLTSYGANLKVKGEKGANVTIAGQTAPYPGITLKGYGLDLGSTHDVIVRNLRLRIGDVLADGIRNQTDPMSVSNVKNTIVDHCTFQWAIDMDFRIAGQNVTFSNMMFGKGLTANSTHEKGGHAYAGAVNEGSSKVSFIKNFIGDSTQRSPRLVDAEWVDCYNNLLYACGNGFDIYNYETQGQNSKYNIYENMARRGSVQPNSTPYRAGRGRVYSGGVMFYYDDNYSGAGSSNPSEVSAASIVTMTDLNDKKQDSVNSSGILHFGKNESGKVAGLESITFDEWDNDPRSYDNNDKQPPAATLVYMDYKLPAPRGNVMHVSGGGTDNTIVSYAIGENGQGTGMGAIRPARDLYDTMIIAELKKGGNGSKKVDEKASLTKEQVVPFFEALEARDSSLDYSKHRALKVDEDAPAGFSYADPQDYKTARTWYMIQGAGPAIKGSAEGEGKNIPINWDTHTDVNSITNPKASSTYNSDYIVDFEIGDWWGEYCGAPGQELIYTLLDNVTGNTVTTNNYDEIDETRYTIIGVEPKYRAVNRTIADLIPAQWVYDRDARHADEEGYVPVAPFMLNYMTTKYPYLKSYSNYTEYQAAKASGTLKDFDFDQAYTSTRISWDGMGDGIPNWYKEYRGWDTTEYLASAVDPESGYTYLEEYINFMADDEPIQVDTTPTTAENFKVIRGDQDYARPEKYKDVYASDKLGYSSVELSWNTDYRASTVIEYGTESGKYPKSEALDYSEAPDGMHTYHAITLANLEPDTTYYYRVTATDELGNTTISDEQTFKTLPRPEGSDVVPAKPIVSETVPYLNQVRLNWTGSMATDESYEIYYDTVDHGSDYSEYANKLTGIDVRTNKQVITGLENNIPYYFLIVAVNSNGKTPSDVITATPSGVLYDFNFPEMTEEEKYDFMTQQFMYILGGNVTMQKDPDTGQNALQMLDETNSHGVNTHLKLPVTQDDKMTYEVTMKVLYQKQTDALNGMGFYTSGNSGSTGCPTTGQDEHNTFQLNFSQDPLVNEDKDSSKEGLWDSAFSIYLDASSRAESTKHIHQKFGGEMFDVDRYDGTYEEPILKFSSTEIGTYNIGKTGSPEPGDTSVTTVPRRNRNDLSIVDFNGYALPYSTDPNNRSTGYGFGSYAYTTPLGDAVYSNMSETGKTLHAMWYYQKGSAQYVTYKIVVDATNNLISIAEDGETVYSLGTFSKDLDPPYNIGKIELKSRNDGYSWVNIQRIKVSNGDGSVSINPSPVQPGATRPQGGGGVSGGPGGGGTSTSTTPTAAPTSGPESSAAPTAAPTAAPDNQKPAASTYTDLSGYEWAEEAISALSALGIVNGTGDGKFSPAQNVTRAEYTTMLMRAFGEDTTAAVSEFSDVDANEWYTAPIGKAVALGVTNGYEDGSFGINDNITREDMMVMAYRTTTALGIAIPEKITYASFADQADISDYAVEAIEKMYCAEIINGVGGGMLDPKGCADRAQSAKIIYGLINMEGPVNE